MGQVDHLVKGLALTEVVDAVVTDDRVVGGAVPADADAVAAEARDRLVEVVVLEDVAGAVDLEAVGDGGGAAGAGALDVVEVVGAVDAQPRHRRVGPLQLHQPDDLGLLTRR